MKNRSVTLRLVLAIVGLELVVVAVLALSLYLESWQYYEREFDKACQARAEAVASLIQVDEDGRSSLDAPSRSVFQRHELVQVFDNDRGLLGQTPDLKDKPLPPGLPRPDRAPINSGVFFDFDWDGRHYRGLIEGFRIRPPSGDRDKECSATVFLAMNTRRLDDAVAELIQSLLITSGAVVLASVAVTIVLISWGLGPIRRAAGEIKAIHSGNVGLEPVGMKDPPIEIRPFLVALNDLLARLGAALRQQRNFTSNASHELRTPMAVIKSTVQGCLLRDRPTADYREAMTEVLEDLASMEHLVDQLLLLARLDENAVAGRDEPISLSAVLADLAADHEPSARQAGVAIEPPRLADVKVRGNRELLGRLFGNLVSNAVVHNRPGGCVCLSLERRDGHAVVEVADTGPGIPPGDLELIFERFYRADSSRARRRGGVGGCGLGLAIAREIADRHGGAIEAANRPEGGALFRVSLPAL